MALCGMPPNDAVASSWTITSPSAALMADTPTVPSLPVPDRITPTALSPWSSASERKHASMGRGTGALGPGCQGYRRPDRRTTDLPGTGRYT